MEAHEAYNVKSEDLKAYWEIIGDTYIRAIAINEPDDDNMELFLFLFEEWKRLYPSFVLQPVKSKVMKHFYFAQTKGFEEEKQIKEEITAFRVFYYLAQYFSLKIQPNSIREYKSESYPDYDMHSGDANRKLFLLLSEIWEELNEGYFNDDFEDFDGDFYDTELSYLQSFLADCWNETKQLTGSTAIAILSEGTAADGDYLLDESRYIEDAETGILDRY